VIEEKYAQIITVLKKGHRYQKKLTENEIDSLNQALKNTNEPKQLEKIFCIIDNTQTRSLKFSKPILDILNSDHSSNILVFALEASRKHVLEANFTKGNRLDLNTLDTFKGLLSHTDPEVVEWTLRVIDEMGGQGIYFKSIFDTIKPKLALFNNHKKNIKMIITMLEKRWEGPRN
jgi:hypothetical protein